MAGKGAAPGERRGGRSKGTPNKFNKQFKDLLTETIHALEDNSDKKEDDPETGLLAWAKKHPTDFYRICSKLVPQEMVGEFTGDITIRVVRD